MSNDNISYSMRSLAQGLSVSWKKNDFVRLSFCNYKNSEMIIKIIYHLIRMLCNYWLKYLEPLNTLILRLKMPYQKFDFNLFYFADVIFFKIIEYSFILQKSKTSKKIELQSLIKLESLFHAFYVCTTHDMSAWTTLVYERCEGV